MTEPVVDEVVIAELRQRKDGTLLGRLVEIFLRDSPNRLAAARAGLAARDLGAVESAVHALRGAAVNFGAGPLVGIAAEIERRAAEGRIEGIETLLAQLDDVYSSLVVRLERELTPLSPAVSVHSQRPRIAVVEDHPVNRALIRALLEDRYELIEYETGKSAISGIQQVKPDLVLLDLGLPDIGGSEVLEALRDDATLTNIPVVALTAHAMAGDRAAALAEGFDEYLTKPLDDVALQETIGRLLRGERGFATAAAEAPDPRPERMEERIGGPRHIVDSAPISIPRLKMSRLKIWRLAPAIIALVLGISLTVYFAMQFHDAEEIAIDTALRNVASDRAEILRVRLAGTVEVLRSIAAFFDASDHVTKKAFQTFVGGAVQRHDELLAAEWLPRVTRSERASFIAAMRREVSPDFDIMEWTEPGDRVPAGSREEYFPATYVEPFEQNRTIIGVDRAALPDRRRAIERAEREGTVVATPPLRLFRLKKTDTDAIGCMFMMPVYRESLDSGKERMELRGFATTVYRTSRLLHQLFETRLSNELELFLFDESEEGGEVLLDSLGPDGEIKNPPSAVELRSERHMSESIDVPGRHWTLLARPTRSFIESRDTSVGEWIIGGFGFVITLLGAGYLFFAATYRERIERLVANRTSELSRKNALLRREERAAIASSEAKSRFLASMSHELRTPLNSVIGFQKILEREVGPRLDHKYREQLKLIGESGRHLLGLIDQILDLSRVEAGRLELHLGQVSLGEIVASVVSQFEPQALEKSIGFEVIAPRVMATIETDSDRFRQVLINLVGNAMKFTERGGVTIRVRTEGDRPVAVEVNDTGPGIPADRLDAIFEAFEQADATIVKRFGGTGLGLAISRSLCHVLGFHLEVESRVGEGTTFRINMASRYG